MAAFNAFNIGDRVELVEGFDKYNRYTFVAKRGATAEVYQVRGPWLYVKWDAGLLRNSASDGGYNPACFRLMPTDPFQLLVREYIRRELGP